MKMKVSEAFLQSLIGRDETLSSDWLLPVCRGSGQHPGPEEEEK